MGLVLDEPKESDNKIDLNGIELLVEPGFKSLLDGQIIDFVSSGFREGFVVSPEWATAC